MSIPANQLPRIHPVFPTRAEVGNDASKAYSDHAMILARVGHPYLENPLSIISLNTLGAINCSGIHPPQATTTDEEYKARYERISQSLKLAITTQQADVICLQEVRKEDLEGPLKAILGNQWLVQVGDFGIITCVNLERFACVKVKSDPRNRVDTFTLQDKQNNNLQLDISNIWGEFSHFPDQLETVCRTKLTETDSSLSIIIGDTNSRIAPLDGKPRNITTGIIPSMFNSSYDKPATEQIPDHPDGGFLRDSQGKIHQLETEVLDFETAQKVEDLRTADEVPNTNIYRMVMCLDDQFQHDNVHTLFEYEARLKAALGTNSADLLVRSASDAFNHRAIGIRFPQQHPSFYSHVAQELASIQGIPWGGFEADNARHLYVPLEQLPALKAALSSYFARPESLRSQAANLIQAQITRLQKKNFFLRDPSQKIAQLATLKQRIEGLEFGSAAEIKAIISQWENEKIQGAQNLSFFGSKGPVPQTNHELMARHRNRFFAEVRPNVKTSVEEALETLKENLNKIG